jgi:hypothetical protein
MIDYGISVQYDGWQDTQTTVPTKIYHLQNTSEYGLRPEELKYTFAQEFANKFVEDGVICINTSRDLYNTRINYTASMTVAEEGITNVVHEQNKFFAYERYWTNKDIIYALKETFPERLL